MNDLNTIEQLVPVFTGTINGKPVQVCDARALHAYLESKWQFADWFKVRVEKYGFEENVDFTSFSGNTEKPQGGRPSKEYHLTLNMAKELGMVENNQRGREIRRYFIQMEQRALGASTASISPDKSSVLIAARAWANMAQIQADTAKSHADAVKNQFDMAKNQADAAQAQADKARLWADEYERNMDVIIPSLPSKPATKSTDLSPISPREQAFIHAWWECFGTKTVTASDLYRAITTKQCQILNDSSGALLGDIELWTAKKLGYALRRWSQSCCIPTLGAWER